MKTARYAALVLEGRLKPWELADLTPRQVEDLYCHPRDDQGRVKFPIAVDPGPVDARANIVRVLALAPLMGVAPAKVEELKRRLAELDGVPHDGLLRHDREPEPAHGPASSDPQQYFRSRQFGSPDPEECPAERGEPGTGAEPV